MEKQENKKATLIFWLLMLLYIFVVLFLTIFRGVNTRPRTLNLLPFATLIDQVESVLTELSLFSLANLLGNFVLFFPLGYFLAFQFPKMRKLSRLFIVFLASTLVIELSQYLLNCGATDIDDMILNVFGGLVGYAFYQHLLNKKKSSKVLLYIGIGLLIIAGIPYYLFAIQKFFVFQIKF